LMDWRWVPTGCSPGSTPRPRPGDRTLDATARRRARVWGGARGRDSAKWDVVVVGAGAPRRHRWVVAACLLTRQHPGKGLGCPVGHRHGEDPLGVPTAARTRRNRCGRAHRHPLLETAAVTAAIFVGGHSVPLKMRRSEALRPQGGLCPCTPDVKGGRTSISAWQQRSTAWIHSAIKGAPRGKAARIPPSSLLSAEQACDSQLAAAPAGS
jgi:hypothetical protein